ncbi:MAG: 16S rRNA (guanine(966)-N(2))-methyltransferase RsmD [Gammaproteobacteria bacterium]|nr:16S rRNA (guanine(966)-N(2))-methyltransferase RsmD [Gammaproteobacteria bacterium]
MARNEVRIIGGKWKGRKLSFPASRTLRPTLGRVRETLFNWLMADLEDARCLDLFAGSGALGFEALSRGARQVNFVDNNYQTAKALRNNVTQLLGNAAGPDRARVHLQSAWKFLDRCQSREEARWEVIFLDPPFDSGSLERALAAIAERNLLTAHGRVYIEQPANTALIHPGWRVAKTSRAGDNQFGLLAREF